MSAVKAHVDAIPDHVLIYHLQSNHYPPITAKAVPQARQAIAAAAQGRPEQVVWFPRGHRTAAQIVEDMHLEGFVDEASAAGEALGLSS